MTLRQRPVASTTRRRPSIEAVPRDGNQPAYRLPDPLPPAAERLHRRQRLAAAFRLFSRHGFEVGLAGHFTARDSIQTDHFWVNPLGMSFAEIRASDLVLVSPAGEVVDGKGMVNLSGVPYHDAIQRARPEVVGIRLLGRHRKASCIEARGKPHLGSAGKAAQPLVTTRASGKPARTVANPPPNPLRH